MTSLFAVLLVLSPTLSMVFACNGYEVKDFSLIPCSKDVDYVTTVDTFSIELTKTCDVIISGCVDIKRQITTGNTELLISMAFLVPLNNFLKNYCHQSLEMEGESQFSRQFNCALFISVNYNQVHLKVTYFLETKGKTGIPYKKKDMVDICDLLKKSKENPISDSEMINMDLPQECPLKTTGLCTKKTTNISKFKSLLVMAQGSYVGDAFGETDSGVFCVNSSWALVKSEGSSISERLLNTFKLS